MRENFDRGLQPQFGEQPQEPEEKTEQGLSPEVIEKIMEKVQDIEAKGTAFTVIDPEGLDSVLDNGLLGNNPFSRGKRPMKRDWIEGRKASKGLVHFNIVGRSCNPFMRGSPTSLRNSYYVQGQREHILLFDISHFEEYPPIPKEEIQKREREKTYSPRTFRAVLEFGYQDLVKRFGEPLPMPGSQVVRDAIAGDPDGLGKRLDQNGLLRHVDSEFGFVLTFRVSPRYFTGLVIKLPAGVFNQQQLQENVEKTASIMRRYFQAKQDLLIPLYDLSGNLRWPMKMSYDEVKKFVAERELKKSEAKESPKPDNPSPE